MRPPWIEPAVLLAAAGAPAREPAAPSIWSRHMMSPAPFALLPRLDAVTRPIVFATLDALATRIERLRAGQALECIEIEDLHFLWRAEGGGGDVAAPTVRDRGVQVWTLLLDGSRDRCIGFAWLNGGGMETLRAALHRAASGPPARPSRALGLIADSSPLRTRLARAAILAATGTA